jgi:transposase
MSTKKSSGSAPKPPTVKQTVVHPDAAGIDIASEVHYVAVPADRDPQSVRNFGPTTDQLIVLADWLQKCGIRTVAMEATGVYWVPLFELLEARGFEVCLVNAQHVRHVPGRKSDVQDCQWLQFLHSVGLLHASFRPALEVGAVRTLLRHRDSLIQEEKEERDTEGFQKSCGLGRSLLRLFANRQPRVGLPQPRIKLVLEPPDNFRVLLR